MKEIKVRRAVKEELPALKEMYRRILAHMEGQGVHIWDDYYPCELLEGDIERGELYALFEGAEPLGAFALCTENQGAAQVIWEEQHASAVYMERLGVSTSHMRKGIAGQLLEQAARIARVQGVDYLRLFGAICNPPALELYHKCGLRQAGGIYHEVIEDDWILDEYGFEQKL